MRNRKFVVLALVTTCAITMGAPARMSVSAPSGIPRQISIQGAPAGIRVQLVDGVKTLGVVAVAGSGSASLTIGSLSSGPHTIRAVEWGTGTTAVEALHLTVPAHPAARLAPAAMYATGIHSDILASGDLHGYGFPDLILGGPGGVSLIHVKDGVPGTPHTLDPAMYSFDGAAPTAITVQDFNGDGLNDLAIACADGRVAILLNRGGDVFSAAHYFAAGAHPSSIVSADFNGDGIPDLAIANQDSNDISLLYGNGDGTFKAAIAIPAGYSPRALVVADFNGDGVADLATANFATNDVSILLGDGHGAFLPARVFPAGNGPVSLVVEDFDEDGAPDLAVLNQIGGTVSVLLNDGSADFRTGASIPGEGLVTGVVAGDVDGDGHVDLLLHAGGGIQVLPGLGNGTFADGYSFQAVASPLLLALELNQDGLPDVAAIDAGGTIAMFRGTEAPGPGGTPTAADETACLTGANTGLPSSGGMPARPGFACVPGYFSRPDPGLKSPDHATPHLDPLANSPSSVALTTYSDNMAFGAYITLTAVVTPSTATGKVTFFDGTTVLGTRTLASGQASMVTNLLPSGSRSLTVFYGGDTSFQASTSPALLEVVFDQSAGGFQQLASSGTGPGPYAVAVADFNGDSLADLVVANSGLFPGYVGSVTVYLGNGNGTFGTPMTYATGIGSSFVAVADFNGDGNPDIAVANWGGTVSVLLGVGNGTFGPATSYPAGNSPFALAVGDFNGDGKADIAVANNLDNDVSLLLGNGDGTFSTAANVSIGNAPEAIVAGDFNGDGKADLAIATGNGVSVLLGNGNATFQPPVNYPAGANPYSLAVADFNGDGKPDLAVANLDGGSVSVLLGNGDGTFQTAMNYPTGPNAEYVVVGDFNGDGVPDLAVANYGPTSGAGGYLSILYGYGNGVFQNAINYAAGDTPFFVAVGNLNGDSSSDLAVVDVNGNSVGVLLGRFAPVTYYKIVNRYSGKVLDVTGVSRANGAVIQQYDYLNGDNQKWQIIAVDSTYCKIVSKNTGKVMDVTGVSLANSAVIQQYSYLDGSNQQWQLVSVGGAYYEIVNRNSGKVLDVKDVSLLDGAVIQQYQYLNGPNQQWQLVAVQ